MKELINKIGTFCVNRLAELVGIIIILASIFIFASLVTYSPEDPNFIFPENTTSETYFVISATNIFSELSASSVSKS